jgi:hypothetical protein
VKASLNEVNAKEDVVVKKLRREVQHLKEILQMKRHKNDIDIQRELLVLKEQNFRLRELASKGEQVERLLQENNNLKQELSKVRAPQNSDGFLVWQNNGLDTSATPDQMSLTYFNQKHDRNADIFQTEVPEESGHQDIQRYAEQLT